VPLNSFRSMTPARGNFQTRPRILASLTRRRSSLTSLRWLIVSKYAEMSPSIAQKNRWASVALQVRYRIASMVRRLGRNPKDCWTKSASKMGSKASRSAS
jgi:hypothetical protein